MTLLDSHYDNIINECGNIIKRRRVYLVMLDNLLFSLNNVFPVFLVILVGVFLKKIGMLDDNAVSRMDLIVFRIALPASLFTNITSTEIKEAFDLVFAVFVVL